LRFLWPVIPIALAGVPLAVRPQALKDLLLHPTSKGCFRKIIAIVHVLLYVCHVREIVNKKEVEQTNTLPLLEYLCLTLGEAVLQESGFWVYTCVAIGWIQVLPHSLLGQMLLLWPERVWTSIVLSIPLALQISKRLSTGGRLSTLLLFSRITWLVLTSSITVHEITATTSGGILVLLLARPCCSKVSQIADRQVWSSRLGRALQGWVRIVQQNRIAGSQTGRWIRCSQMAVAVISVQAAGWILSSFLWACFPWRWLFNRQASRNPSWTMFSFFGGALFFPVLAVIKLVQVGEPVGDLGVLTHKQVSDCVAATWWTSCIYLLLWAICEIVDRMVQG
jgi:hypothetical protein